MAELKNKTSKKLQNITVPPYSEEAEQAVLGSILMDKNSLVKISDLLIKDDFYFEKHSLIWEEMMFLQKNHSPIDLLTISRSLETKKQLESLVIKVNWLNGLRLSRIIYFDK